MKSYIEFWNAEFDRLSEKTESEILVEISEGVYANTDSDESKQMTGDEGHGREWVENTSSIFSAYICQDERIRELIGREKYTLRNLFFVLVEILSSIVIYVPVGAAAMILARRGLKALCGDLVTSDAARRVPE